jgi:acyl carrier protein
MNHDQALALISEALNHIAPDVNPATIDPRGELTVEADLDSMDFLRLVTDVSERIGHDIPERNYPQLISLASFASYLGDLTQPATSRG